MDSFGTRLDRVFEARGQLCLGIDPHPFLLADWGLEDSATGVREFGLRAVGAAAGIVGIIKPQVAFFERHGSAGYAALEAVLTAARTAGLLVIADVKRGDLGTSVAAYARAWLTPGSTLEVDAMTMVAYQGVGSLAEPIALATETGKGVFLLAATSNPEAVETQTALRQEGRFAGSTVAAGIVGEVDELNPSGALGSVGVVIGATVKLDDYGIGVGRLAFTPILAPGFGEQGAQLANVSGIYGDASRNAIVSVSRSALRAGPRGLAAELTTFARTLGETLTR
ncbi:MAG: orotidine-5'-phosphate decarboxylase [Rhodoglobus sp.]